MAATALPIFDAPIWVLRVMILLLAIGFPIALILAWAVELSTDGVKIDATGVGSRRMLAVSVVLLVLAFVWYYRGQPAVRQADMVTAPTSPAVVVPTTPERSIAVLPFVNMNGDPDNEYFSDGLAETTLDMLAHVSDLKVIARTSSFAFKGKAQDMRKIGAALGAAHLLEGSVQQSGKTVRITVQLIRTSAGSHLWSQRYDRELADVFSIQDEIATEVVKALQLALPAAEKQQLLRKRTDNVAAYQEYLRGNALLPGRRVADMRQALAHFERAIELDPNYARTYAAAATTSLLLEDYSTTSAEEKAKRTRYIEQALALDPKLGEAYIARASMLQNAQDLNGADQAFRRGTELAPGYATGFQWYGELLLDDLADVDRAMPMFKRAVALDPLSPVVRAGYARGLAISGHEDEALALSAKLIRDHPGFAMAYPARRDLFEARGDLVGALKAQKALELSDPDSVRRKVSRCRILSHFGALAQAQACLADLNRRFPEVDTRGEQISLMALQGDFAGALAAGSRMERQEPWSRIWLLQMNGRDAEALPLLQTLVPEFFVRPIITGSSYPSDAIFVGAALLRTGATDHGREVLRFALKNNAAHPYDQLQYGRGWWDV